MISSAIDLGRVNIDLTRLAADKIKTTPYAFVVLNDTTLRRTWRDGNRSISIDFSPSNDKMILAEIKYTNPVSLSAATHDAKRIGRTSSSAWKKTKAASVAKIGLGNAMMMKLGNGSYIFIESLGGGKVSSLLLFRTKPTENRRDISAFDGVVSSALGVAAGGDANENLQADEERRWKLAYGAKNLMAHNRLSGIRKNQSNQRHAPRSSSSAQGSKDARLTGQNENARRTSSPSKSAQASVRTSSGIKSFFSSLTQNQLIFGGAILGFFFLFLIFRSGSK